MISIKVSFIGNITNSLKAGIRKIVEFGTFIIKEGFNLIIVDSVYFLKVLSYHEATGHFFFVQFFVIVLPNITTTKTI